MSLSGTFFQGMETGSPHLRIGIAGWALDRKLQPLFPSEGTHLQRYAARFDLVEINSSFYRPHKPETYRRWAESVPPSFRFSAKVPKEITHIRRLRDFAAPLDDFLSEVTALGGKLGPLVVQLPPSGWFDPETARAFFKGFRERFSGRLALEPRHPSWATPEAESLLRKYGIAKVAADPEVIPGGSRPGGWPGFAYRRLHGSPKVYHSPYPESHLESLADSLEAATESHEIWCIFDNTAAGHAIPDALRLQALREKNVFAG